MNKLIPAIRSRCTIYHMRGLHPTYVRRLLIKVGKAEGKVMPEGVNQAIINIVHGDMRLALNILEALLTLESPTPEDVHNLTGLADESNVFSMMHGALKGNMSALNKMQSLLSAGASAQQLINTMYWMSIRGGRGMSEEKRLNILSVIGTIPGVEDTMILTSILARLILKQGKVKDDEST